MRRTVSTECARQRALRALRAGAAAAALAASLALAPAAQALDASDPWITTKVKVALLSSEGVDGLDVNVDTRDGRVTLHGTAATEAERERAETLAKQVEGVREVRNLIQVVPADVAEAVGSLDEQTRERVREALADDPELAGSEIEVKSVNQGVVVLAGRAKTLSAHLDALETARDVDGVRRVASEIRSPNELADEEIWRDVDVAAAPADSAGQMATDLWITTATKVRLMAADVPALDVNVDAEDGVVTLFGSVPSEAAKKTAEAEARKAAGVREVRNELQVVPESRREQVAREDEQIRSSVAKSLEQRAGLSDSAIEVQVENGVVRLTGTVDSQGDRLAALTLARQNEGVRSVIGDLSVERKE